MAYRMTPYEQQHLELLKGIISQLTRIADSMEGLPAEDDIQFSEETIEEYNNLATMANTDDLVRAIDLAAKDLGEIGKAYNN